MSPQTQPEMNAIAARSSTRLLPFGACTPESRTHRKLQLRLPPFLFLLYVIAFIDRINIGFTALTMNKELAITTQQFGFATVFFLGYFLFEVPSNLLLQKVGARIWIARILVTWGRRGRRFLEKPRLGAQHE